MTAAPVTRDQLANATHVQVVGGRWLRITSWDRHAARMRAVHPNGATTIVRVCEVLATRTSGLPARAMAAKY
jgi:hypothetical protein